MTTPPLDMVRMEQKGGEKENVENFVGHGHGWVSGYLVVVWVVVGRRRSVFLLRISRKFLPIRSGLLDRVVGRWLIAQRDRGRCIQRPRSSISYILLS